VESRQSELSSRGQGGNWLDQVLGGGLALFLVLLPFHLVIKKLVPDPVGTYWKEILLVLLVLVWGVRSLQLRKLQWSGTPLDWAVLAYLGLLVVRALLDRAGLATAWGLYISILYLPLFWLIPALLRRSPGWLAGLAWLLTGVGAVVALGGVLEFILDKTLWPSAEMIQRQGFPDVYVYGTHLRRVYFVFDSPTTLANTLAMLLPMALALAAQPGKLWRRILAGAAAGLMAVCLVVTFSRGIWVAAGLALLFLVVQSRFVQRNLRPLAAALSVVVLAVLAWAVVMAPRMTQPSDSEKRIRELPVDEFRAVQAQVVEEFSARQPTGGAVTLQTWSLLDPITRQVDERRVIYQHPTEAGKGEIYFTVQVPENGALRFGIALSPEVWSPEKGDGASFELFVSKPGETGAEQVIFNRYINPKINPPDRRWRNYFIDLSPWAGQTINLILVTASGPANNWNYDWAGWAEMQLVQVDPVIFAQGARGGENLLFDHLGSIMDWSSDETNRDRLAAWNLSLGAWLQNPLWGAGIGSTGVAALRTNPESAFATESQVLKALTELGVLGLLSLAYLWFEIVRAALRARGREQPIERRFLWMGLTAGLVAVFIESLVYQNLEVKQVNAYFWTFAGMLAFLAAQQTPAAAVSKAQSERVPASQSEAALTEAPAAEEVESLEEKLA